jgi:hypothetical protein
MRDARIETGHVGRGFRTEEIGERTVGPAA